MQDVTAITVNYNTPDLVKRAIRSIRKFYPELFIYVINLSTDKKNIRLINGALYQINKNIGHGPGLHYGLQRVTTKYALCFDSDIVMKRPPIEIMVERCNGKYGVGPVVQVNKFGVDVKGKNIISYLHPHFMLLNVEEYFKWHPLINHGAPCLKTMLEMHSKGRSSDLLVNMNVGEYILHEGRGTRKLNPKEFEPRNWDKIKY